MTAINKLIKVNHYYTRAINLVRDADSLETIQAYIPTTRSLHTLRQIAETFKVRNAPRAWALIGPYGSGKSLLAVFLSHLLGNAAHKTTETALDVLCDADKKLANAYLDVITGQQGCCRVLLTGSPAPLGKRLLQALAEGAQNFWRDSKKAPPIVAKLNKAAQAKEYSHQDILDLLIELQQAVANSDGTGVYIAIDELGKFLEYQASQPHVNDIHLLQSLAEHSQKAEPAPVYLVVLLHQAFEQYARGLGKKLQDEWLKIQGRFESIAFLEAAEQTLRIVKSAFTHQFKNKDYPELRNIASQATDVLHAAGALPGYLDKKNAAQLFYGCYPLHPVALLLLPHLCQKVAQNERTLFSYLGSRELHGFQERLSHLQAGDWVDAADIYDYFLLNQATVIADTFTHHHWMEVITALDRLGDDAPLEQIKLLKTIGLLNIVGSQGRFKASKAVLGLCHPDMDEARQTAVLDELVKKSCIHFRSFNQEYRVWQGTDFDLHGILREEVNRLGRLALAETLNERKILSPLVARRHSIETGTLRYFIPLFIDAESLNRFKPDAQQLQAYFYLASGEEEIELFNKLLEQAGDLDILIFCPRMERLHDTVAEVMGLLNMQRHHATLQNDPVAQREHRAWLNAAEQNEQRLLHSFLETPQSYQWYWRGQQQNIANKRHLQACLSDICDDIYHATPIIRNELLNRTHISSSASTGRNKLFAAMLAHGDEAELGIDKFPAEKSMYLALLQESGIHREEAGTWQFLPPPEDNPFRFHQAWGQIDDFLLQHEGQAQPLLALYEVLQKPPYGLKTGILSVLFAAYYFANQREIALYEDSVFCPTLIYEHLELLSKRPERYTLERFQIKGMRLAVFRRYLETILGKIPEDATLLDIIRPLAKFIRGLPVYTQKTKNLSAETLAVRDTFDKAKSPSLLLFTDLPQACHYAPFDISAVNENRVEGYMQALLGCLRELKGAYEGLLEDLQMQLAQALKLTDCADLASLRAQVQQRFTGLEQYTGGERQDLFAFIRRLSSTKHDDQAWLESVATLLGRIPPAKWQEEHRQQADVKLAELSERLLDLATLDKAVRERPTACDYRTVLIRSVDQEKGEQPARIVYINRAQESEIKDKAQSVRRTLGNMDEQTQLAIIAEILGNWV